MSHLFRYKINTYDIFGDIINMKTFDLNNIEIDEKSDKGILIYYTGYVTVKIRKM